MKALFDRINRFLSRLGLGPKIYLGLSAILLPVFAITLIVQAQVISPLLEDEVLHVGISVCRSVATDILATHLLGHDDKLEATLVNATWMQPSITRLDVIVPTFDLKTKVESFRIAASNLVEETPLDLSTIRLSDTPHTELRREAERSYWEIVYPIVDRKKTVAFLHAEVSLQLVSKVVETFSRVALLGALLSLALLIWLLSFYVRRMIASERELSSVTDALRETERQLLLNEKLAIMGQLTASFAHEIGTPLNSLSGHLHLLKDEVTADSSKSRIQVIESQVTRIAGIVKDFLNSTRMPSQQRQLVAVNDAIRRITQLVEPRLRSILGHSELNLDPQVEAIRMVPTDLEQILINLANNAIDALASKSSSSEERCVSISSRQSDDRKTVWITVSDNGEGMSPDIKKQILKPFFTTKPPGQGTGLGLTISQRLVRKYGGSFEIDSSLGKGTTIKVQIPYEPT